MPIDSFKMAAIALNCSYVTTRIWLSKAVFLLGQPSVSFGSVICFSFVGEKCFDSFGWPTFQPACIKLSNVVETVYLVKYSQHNTFPTTFCWEWLTNWVNWKQLLLVEHGVTVVNYFSKCSIGTSNLINQNQLPLEKLSFMPWSFFRYARNLPVSRQALQIKCKLCQLIDVVSI